MKWILITGGVLVGLVVLAVVVLLAVGSREGADRISTLLEIDRPPETVWLWLTEPDKQKQWISWLVEVRDETPGIRGAGKRVVWVMDDPNMKQKIEIRSEVVIEEPPKMFSVRLSSDLGFEGTSAWRLTDLDGRTRLDSWGNFRYTRWVGKLFGPLVMPQARKKAREDAATLKRLVEAEPAGSASQARL